MASLGVLFSLRSSTVQEAQQALMAVLMLTAMLLQFAAVLLRGSPSGQARLSQALATVSLEQAILVVVFIFLMIDLALLMAAMARFKRSRLIVG
jgi:hypothetical protein